MEGERTNQESVSNDYRNLLRCVFECKVQGNAHTTNFDFALLKAKPDAAKRYEIPETLR